MRSILNIQLSISLSSPHPWSGVNPAPGVTVTGWALPAFRRLRDGENSKHCGGRWDTVACGVRTQRLLRLVWSFVSTVWKSGSTARCSQLLTAQPPARTRTDPHGSHASAPPRGRDPAVIHPPGAAQGLAPHGMPHTCQRAGRMHQDPRGSTRMHSCLQGTGVRPGQHQRGAHTRERLGMLNSPQGHSRSKITHHRLHAVFWLCSPLLLSDSSIF